MIDRIIVRSRPEMVDLTFSEDLADNCAIVSISDCNAEPPQFNQNANIYDILTVFFNDEEYDETRMSQDDARSILDFVKDVEDAGVETLYVHCNGGVSRSAGTAAALMLLWFGTDNDIFNNGIYSPNMHCYRTVLDEAGFGYNEDEITQKEARNYNLWRILNLE